RILPQALKARPSALGWSPWRTRTRAKTSRVAQTLTEAEFRLAANPPAGSYAAGHGHSFAYLLGAPDRPAMVELLSRLAATAPWLSDAQLQDLAVHCSRSAAVARESGQDEVRIALTAAGQAQLAGLAAAARALLPDLRTGMLTTRPGIYAAAGLVSPATAARSPGATEADGTAGEAGCAGEAGTSGLSGRVGLVISAQPDELANLPQRQLSRIL